VGELVIRTVGCTDDDREHNEDEEELSKKREIFVLCRSDNFEYAGDEFEILFHGYDTLILNCHQHMTFRIK
jgi:hypothetical protein